MTDSKRVTREGLAAVFAGFTGEWWFNVMYSAHGADVLVGAIFDALPATPAASGEVDAAWEALLQDLWDHFGTSSEGWLRVSEHHRPLIEAAIRVQALREFGGDDPIGAWNSAYQQGLDEGRAESAGTLDVGRLARAITYHSIAQRKDGPAAYLDHKCMGDCATDLAAEYAHQELGR